MELLTRFKMLEQDREGLIKEREAWNMQREQMKMQLEAQVESEV
jgi:hypothetical protein